MTLVVVANLLPSSFVSHVKELKPRYSKLMVIIALAVGKREPILTCNFVLSFTTTIILGQTATCVLSLPRL